MRILTALLVSHGTLMNSRYTALVTSNAYLWEKVKSKASHLIELCFEIYNLEKKYEKTQQDCRVSDQENKDLHSFRDASSHEIERLRVQLAGAEATATRDLEKVLALERSESQKHRDIATTAEKRFDDLRGETDVEFEEADPNVSNFFFGPQVEFDKAVASLPYAQFPFLAKISKVAESALPEVTSIQPDKIVCPTVSASPLAMSSPASKKFGWTSTPKDSGLAHDASPPWLNLSAVRLVIKELIARREETCAPSLPQANSFVAFPIAFIVNFDCVMHFVRR
ncbi:hypothetical protein Tco_0066162 [Tanacetum coccineum]